MTHHLRPQHCTVPGCREVAAYASSWPVRPEPDVYYCPFHAATAHGETSVVKLPPREVEWGGKVQEEAR